MKAPVVSTSLLGEPVGATLLAVLLLAEIPSATDLLGGALALLGIYLTARATIGYRATGPSLTGTPGLE